MTIHVNIGEAKAQLSRLIAASLRGEEVVIDHAGKPQVRLTPIAGATEAGRLDRSKRIAALLAEMDRIPEREDGFDPLEWDDDGLPV